MTDWHLGAHCTYTTSLPVLPPSDVVWNSSRRHVVYPSLAYISPMKTIILRYAIPTRQFHYQVRNMNTKSPFKVIDNSVEPSSPALQAAKQKSQASIKMFQQLLKICSTGGSEKDHHRHTKIKKKLFARDRLKMLFDPDSECLELSSTAGLGMQYGDIPAAGCITAIGRIQGIYCLVTANDATIKGGTMFPVTVSKCIRAQEIAMQNRLPCIHLVDSGGAFLPLQANIFPDKKHGGRVFRNQAVMTADGIPQIAVVCGNCTAGGAYIPTMSEESIIVHNMGSVFLGGPPLVKAATGEVVSENDLGGADLHCRFSGATDYYAETESEAFDMCHGVVSSLNRRVYEPSTVYEEPLYPAEQLNDLAGMDEMDRETVYQIIARIVDASKFHEFKAKYGTGLVVGFGHVCGMLTGFLANYNKVTARDAQKGAHFIDLCNQRDVPLVFLQNSCKSITSGEPVEDAILLKEKSKMMSSLSTANVPKLSFNIKSCIGDDIYTMCGPSFEPNFYFNWPLAEMHVVDPSLNEEKDGASEDKVKSKGSKTMSHFDFPVYSSFYNAANILNDGIIIPQDTRKTISFCMKAAYQFREESCKRRAVVRM